MSEYRTEVLWRCPAPLDNPTLEALAEDAEETHEWLLSRWADGPAFDQDGFYVTGYVEATTQAEAARIMQDAVVAWTRTQSLSGHVGTVKAEELDLAEYGAGKPTLPELASATDAARILGVSRQRVNELARTHPAFPPPLLRVATGPLWTRRAIEHFAATRDRAPGRTRRPDAA